MEAFSGVATLWRLGNWERSPPHLVLGLKSRAISFGNSSSFLRFGPFASREERRLISVQRSGVRRWESLRVSAQVGEETESSQGSADTSESAKGVKGKGFGAPRPVVEKKRTSSSSSSIRRAPPQKALIGAQVDEETRQFETVVVASLGFLFALIIFEGIALAASGFLPEEWDEFLLKVIYPIFTPTVGVFLAGAAGYGVWKFFGLGEKGPTSK